MGMGVGIARRTIFRECGVYVRVIEHRRGVNLDARGLMGCCGAGICGSVARICCVRNTAWALRAEISKDVAAGAVELTDCVFAETAGREMGFYLKVTWTACMTIGTGAFCCSAWRSFTAKEAAGWLLGERVEERIEGKGVRAWYAKIVLRWVTTVCPCDGAVAEELGDFFVGGRDGLVLVGRMTGVEDAVRG